VLTGFGVSINIARLTARSRAKGHQVAIHSRKQTRCLQHLFRPRPHPVILSQHSPTNDAGCINQKLGGTCDVAAIFTLAFVNQIVFRNRLELRIGKKSKSVAGLLTKIAGRFRTIDANRDRTNSDFVELSEILLNAPQLGVARRSPVAAIENEEGALCWFAVDWLR